MTEPIDNRSALALLPAVPKAGTAALRLSGGATGGEQAMTDARIEVPANVPEEHLPEALAALSPATYEKLREGFAKRLDFRVSAVDRMYKEGVSKAERQDKEIEDTTTPRKSQVTRLIEIARLVPR
jgi:hypothetical protein